MKFTEFGLNERLLEAISYMNFEEATEIQEKAIPEIMEGKDLIGCAQTGTGKTAAFILPTLHQIATEKKKGTSVLVLVPTRELAIQIDQQIQGLAYFTETTSTAVYGGGDGVSWEQERMALSQGSDVIIATPGRLIAHLNNGYVKFDTVSHLILDEADRMLDIGFHDDIIKIISFLPKKRQGLLFSATMAPKIRKLAKEILHNPGEISIAVSKPAEGVTQQVYLAFEEQKATIVKNVLKDKDSYQSIIIFCSTRRKVEQLARKLKRQNFNARGISSDYDQEERETAILDFKSRKTRILVATDVMSRGIDIKDINLVINYDVPGDAEDYVHRIGRTARAATKGMAITLVNEEEMYKFQRIEQLIERELEKLPPPEELGPGPEWKINEKGGKKKRYGGNSNKKKFYGNRKNKKPFAKGKQNPPRDKPKS
jgi:superfamily II DNA/RNA helicase